MTNKNGRWGLKAVTNRHYDDLSRVDPEAFERLLADYYREQGFTVDHCGASASRTSFDGGIDLKLRKDNEFILVQCKRWNAKQVTHNAVHELLGIMVNQGATGAIVITSGEITTAAKLAGSKHGHVQLVDGIEVRRMLGDRLNQLAESSTAPAASPVPFSEDRSTSNQAEPRTREPRRRRGRRSESADELLIKFVVGVIFILLAMFVLPGMLSKALQPAAQRTTNSQAVPAALPAQQGSDTKPATAFSPDNLQRQSPPPPPTAEEIALARTEQARQAAETQRYLETVPEVTHYSYSPLDQNRDPPSQHSGNKN